MSLSQDTSKYGVPLYRRISIDVSVSKDPALKVTQRRGSFDTTTRRQESTKNALAYRRKVSFCATTLLRNGNLTTNEISSKTKQTDVEGNQELKNYKLPNLIENDTAAKKLHVSERCYTMITAPVQLHAPSKPQLKKRRSQPVIGSKLPSLPDIERPVTVFGGFENDVAAVDENSNETYSTVNGEYIPKPCWCMRCQIMLSMFRTGDKRLELWGNYPCFRR